MRVLLLGARRRLNENRWKDDLAEAGQRLGWDMLHVDALGIDAEQVCTLAKDRDLLIWARTHGHDPTGDIAGMLRRVEDFGVTTVSLHLDLYWTVANREPQIGVHPWWSSQHVFTADGALRNWVSRGVNHHWCPPAMGHRFLGRARADRARFPYRACFVGTCSARVHGPHRIKLLEWAARKWGTAFGRFGGRDQLWGRGLSTLYASVDVVLGDSAAMERAWSDRLPITLGRGGLLAFPRIPGMAEQGFTDEVMVTFDRFNFGAIGERLAQIGPGQRRDMADAALALIEERHMWTHRLKMIADTVGVS